MKKEEYIKRYGEAGYTKQQVQTKAWKEAHPNKKSASDAERYTKGGKYYDKQLEYQQTGLRGKRSRVRIKHGKIWRPYKNIIAPESQIHHE